MSSSSAARTTRGAIARTGPPSSPSLRTTANTRRSRLDLHGGVDRPPGIGAAVDPYQHDVDDQHQRGGNDDSGERPGDIHLLARVLDVEADPFVADQELRDDGRAHR